jgi:hypothetical protein
MNELAAFMVKGRLDPSAIPTQGADIPDDALLIFRPCPIVSCTDLLFVLERMLLLEYISVKYIL